MAPHFKIYGIAAVDRVVAGPIGRGGGRRDIRCGVVVRNVATEGTPVSMREIGGGSRDNPCGGVVQRVDEFR